MLPKLFGGKTYMQVPIMVEIGFAFNAIIGVENGKIIAGIGGTSAGPGFVAQGKMDGEGPINVCRMVKKYI